jgi:hypothetical protein
MQQTEVSTTELAKEMSEQVSLIVRDEMKLARLEMTRKGKQAGAGVGALGASGLIVSLGLFGVARKATPPVPQQAAASVKADVDQIMERARR